MKNSLLSAIVVISTLVPAFALTEADITPAALVGKTLNFNITNGGAPFATQGSWRGSFSKSGNGFSVTNVTGNTVPISTTYTAAVNGAITEISLGKFIEGRGPATLSLLFIDGTPTYEVFINDLSGVNVSGSFKLNTVPPRVPEIVVSLDKAAEEDKEIQSDASDLDIGSANIGKSASRTFTITNTGSAPLRNLALSINGKNQADYRISALKKDQLAVKESIKFKVTFRPRAAGARVATVRITSNDTNESPFKINLSSNGFKNK